MKILMLHNRYLLPGGEDQSTAAEVALLRDYGCEIELIEQDNRQIERLGKIRTAVRTVWSAESYKQVYGALEKGRFDILHVQNFFPLWSPSVYYAAVRCGIPVVQTLRNYRLMCVNSTFFRNGQVCEDCLGKFIPWSGVVHACYRQNHFASAVVATMIGGHKLAQTWQKQVTAYIALTEFARQKFVQAGFPSEKIMIKPNVVYPEPKPGSGGGGYAFFAGRLSAGKGIETMLAAWQQAQTALTLKIAGDGPQAEFVKAAAEGSSRIEYLGRKSPAEVSELASKAEFLIFPSESYEGMPRTVIESFAVGTPVVASNIGATASMVVPEETGFHFLPGNIADLRERVEWCSLNLESLRAMRSKTRLAFEANYSGVVNAKTLLEIYKIAQERTASRQNKSS